MPSRSKEKVDLRKERMVCMLLMGLSINET